MVTRRDLSGNNPPETFLSPPSAKVSLHRDKHGENMNFFSLNEGQFHYEESVADNTVYQVDASDLNVAQFDSNGMLYIEAPYRVICLFALTSASPVVAEVALGIPISAGGDQLKVPDYVNEMYSLYFYIPLQEGDVVDQTVFFGVVA